MPGARPAAPRTRGVELSVVVPVYGCRGCLHALHTRLTASVAEITPDYELIFVDDRSEDGGWDVLRELANADAHVRALRLSRNFGQHAAITAGLAESAGRWTVVMDCDLQEPPEAIKQLYAKAREGYEVVLTARRSRQEGRLRATLGRAYVRLRSLVVGMKVRGDHGTLSLLSRRAVDAFLTVRDRDREYILILYWLGFERAVVEFEHAERFEGDSSYTGAALIRASVEGFFFQTTALLRWVVYAGVGLAIAGFLLAGYYLFSYVVNEHVPAGYTSLAILLLVLGGFAILSIGVVGLYVGKVFDQSKGRPLYVVDEKLQQEPEPGGLGETDAERALSSRGLNG